jgi:bidirectional [NiFe] hydrogenase diaphorase subunit
LEGQTILQAAKANGKYIPTLCDLEGLTPVGACRLCIVEVSGIDRLIPACTTPIQDGMSVTTTSARLTHNRRISLELLFVERNHVCAACVSNGHCELQSLASAMGISTVRFAYNYPKLGVDLSHPRFRARPQPLHPVYPVRPCMRRPGGSARVGNDVARDPRQDCE